MTRDRQRLQGIYRRLLTRYGPQHWWPAETPFEVMVGAVLTQNTAWLNVERAIDNLRRADLLSPGAIAALPAARLASHLRPAGYFNVKAKRLRALCLWLREQGDLQHQETQSLRARLLSVHGVGPETADDILLYAFERPVFVIDAYTRRLFGRLGYLDPGLPYERLRQGFERALGAEAALFNEYHALIVVHAKEACRPRPRCETCCLRRICAFSNPGLSLRPLKL